MKNRKMNKAIAGYHMLMLLSNVDGDFTPDEGALIVDYLSETFPFRVNLDNEIEFISKLKREDYLPHFAKAMDDFYQDSTEHERADFISFAVKMVKADNKITPTENIFLEQLLDGWDPDGID
jgi:uncharacterized tellurite resistance protein B-like protein